MEPVGATVSLVAGLASIVTAVGKSITSLYNLQKQWKEGDLTVNFLIGQLKAVKAALYHVQLWAQSVPEQQDQQLLVGLNDLLYQCRSLIDYLDDQVLKFCSHDNHLNSAGRLLLILEDKTTNSYLSMLDRIVSALNLLLTAANQCRSAEDQRRWLSAKSNRTILSQVKDDTSSLLALHHKSIPSTPARRASVSTSHTRFSTTFAFDEILLKHKIYQKSLRSVLRRAVRPIANLPSPVLSTTTALPRSQSDTVVPQLTGHAVESARIDAQIRQEARHKSRSMTILAVGSGDETSTAVKLCCMRKESFSISAEIETYRRQITCFVLKALCAVITYAETSGRCFHSEQGKVQAAHLNVFSSDGAPEYRITTSTAEAVRGVWQNWHVMAAFQAMNQHCTTAFFLRSITRICQPDYIPTLRDIIKAPDHIDTIKETSISLEKFTATMIEINHATSRKYMNQFHNANAILYVVDSGSYDGESTTHHNAMRGQISQFKRYCNSRWYVESFILLCLTYTAVLAQKLLVSPLNGYFKDYAGGNDVSAATKYFIRLFKQVNPYKLPLYCFAGDLDPDRNTIQKFVGDCIYFQRCGI